ncbi:MAG: hypothetical protein Q9191_008041 [Dirinaria sp. TL-2023a]
MPPISPTISSILDSHPSNPDTSETDIDIDSDIDNLLDTETDPTETALREHRLQQLHSELSRARDLRRDKTHGSYVEVTDEKEVLEITTGTGWCVVHFLKPEFGRCAVMDGKIEALAPHHIETRFLRINVENAPFLVAKLKIQVLPCVIVFVDGISVDRIIGFEGLGYSEDTFTARDLEARLLKAGVLARLKLSRLDDGGEPRQRLDEVVHDGEEDDDDWD